MNRSPRRIVVSGLGLISPLGFTTEGFWNALMQRQSGVRPFFFQKPGDSPIPFAAKCVDFNGEIEHFGELGPGKKRTVKKATKLMSREIQMGVASAQKAILDAGIVFDANGAIFCKNFSNSSETTVPISPNRVGVSFGCDLIYSEAEELIDGIRACTSTNENQEPHFDFTRWANDGLAKMSPLWQLKYLSNMPSSHIAILNDFRGPNNSAVLREASIGPAIGEAVEILRSGKVDFMLVGATGSRIHPLKMIQAILLEEVAAARSSTQSAAQFTDIPEEDFAKMSRPFDKTRCGMVLGEGAGALILEPLEHAQKRGAKIYAEILGGYSTTALRAASDSFASTLERLMRQLLQRCEMEPKELGHINAQGFSCKKWDALESQAIANVFEPQRIPTTTIKGHTGNLGAGSGAVELIAGILALQNDQLFPTLNFRESDPKCPITPITETENFSGNSFLKLAFNSQGQASAVLVKKS